MAAKLLCQKKVRADITDAILRVCKSHVQFESLVTVEGLLGITLDEQEIFLVNVNASCSDLQKEPRGELGKPIQSEYDERRSFDSDDAHTVIETQSSAALDRSRDLPSRESDFRHEQVVDRFSTAIIPPEVPGSDQGEEPYCALQSKTDGNCLYNSVSQLLTGDEDLAFPLRSTVAFELRQHSDLYYSALESISEKSMDVTLKSILPRDVLTNTGTLEDAWELEILQSNYNKRWCSILHLMALATILGREIISVYAAVPYILRHLYHRTFRPVRIAPVPKAIRDRMPKDALTDKLVVLWTRDGTFDNTATYFEPNHVVPLVPSVHLSSQTKPLSSASVRKRNRSSSWSTSYIKQAKISDYLTDKEGLGESNEASSKKVHSNQKDDDENLAVPSTSASSIIHVSGADNSELTETQLSSDLDSIQMGNTENGIEMIESGLQPSDLSQTADLKPSHRHTRLIKADWFKIFEWLEYDKRTNRFYCRTCISHNENNLYTRGKTAVMPKKDDFNKHANTRSHINAVQAELLQRGFERSQWQSYPSVEEGVMAQLLASQERPVFPQFDNPSFDLHMQLMSNAEDLSTSDDGRRDEPPDVPVDVVEGSQSSERLLGAIKTEPIDES